MTKELVHLEFINKLGSVKAYESKLQRLSENNEVCEALGLKLNEDINDMNQQELEKVLPFVDYYKSIVELGEYINKRDIKFEVYVNPTQYKKDGSDEKTGLTRYNMNIGVEDFNDAPTICRLLKYFQLQVAEEIEDSMLKFNFCKSLEPSIAISSERIDFHQLIEEESVTSFWGSADMYYLIPFEKHVHFSSPNPFEERLSNDGSNIWYPQYDRSVNIEEINDIREQLEEIARGKSNVSLRCNVSI